MAYTLERVQKEFNIICNKAGVEVDTPIKLNGRLTKCLGRVKYCCLGGECAPILVEFSKQLLKTATDNSILGIIKHEAAHFIVLKRTCKNHGHDAVFKAVCKEIGTTNDKPGVRTEKIVDSSSVFKYEIFCPTCNKKLKGGFHRKGNIVKKIDICRCAKCGQTGLKVIQNW